MPTASCRILSVSDDIDARLSELGLEEGVVTQAVLAGQAAMDSCTENDAPSIPGTLRWGVTLRRLREELRTWTKSDRSNFSIVISPTSDFAIAVMTGDASTGRIDIGAVPSTKYPKGPATGYIVEANQAQLSLFPKASALGMLTYILLIASDDEELRYELSLPDLFSEDGYVVRWKERIVFPPIRLSDEPVGGHESEPEIDIPVTPRRS